MTPESSAAAFDRQVQSYKNLFWAQVRKGLSTKLASPKTVLGFAELLMLCPTEEAAKIHIQRDLEAARGCCTIACDVASAADVGRALVLIPVGTNETPFCLLGFVVCRRAQAAIDKYGDSWTGHPGK